MSLHQFIQFIKYRLKAKNRHGIHSPFVYALVDQCLLSGKDDLLRKRLPEYFGKEHVGWFRKDPKKWQQELQFINDTSVYIIPNIHRTAQHTNAWEQLIHEKSVMLTIDLFKVGLVMNRKDFKEKQHFVLQTK